MSFYRTNAICGALRGRYEPPFFVPEESSWLLIYGDSNSIPKVLVLAKACPTDKLTSKPSPKEEWASIFLKNIAQNSGFNPEFLHIRFDIQSPEVSSIMLSDTSANSNWRLLELQTLTSLFAEAGLPVSNTVTAKAINDRSSSAYHNWQRNSLGRGVVVSDIDLIRQNQDVTFIYELKRSYYELERWKPFEVDYNNFKVIANLSSLNFQIVYNKRLKSPSFQEFIDTVAVFDVGIANGQLIIGSKRIMPLEDFIRA